MILARILADIHLLILTWAFFRAQNANAENLFSAPICSKPLIFFWSYVAQDDMFSSKKAEVPIEGIVVNEETGRISETPEARVEGLRRLRIAMEEAVKNGKIERFPRTDDQFLLAFLRARKYKISSSMEVLLNFSKFWYNNPELINGLCAARVRRVYEMGMMEFLPGKDVNGNSLTVLRMAKIDYSKFTPRELIQMSVYILCKMFDDEDMQVHGVAYLETMENFSMLQSMSMTRHLKKEDTRVMMTIGLDTFPMRIREIYLIKQPGWFSVFWAMVRPFLKAKLVKRLKVIGTDYEVLYKLVAKKDLPTDFGGDYAGDIASFLNDMQAKEESQGQIGGWAMPMSVEDPTGKNRAQPMKEAQAAGPGHAMDEQASLPPASDPGQVSWDE